MFADIILPIPLPRLFTYKIPTTMDLECSVGKRVTIPFGKSKIYSGIVYALHHTEPKEYEVKEIISILDTKPIVNAYQLKFWLWITDYYLCTLGEVYQAALPSGLKLESETKLCLNNDIELNSDFSSKETQILDELKEKKTLLISDLSKITGLKSSIRYVNSLLEKGIISVEESVQKKYKAKTESFVCLHENIKSNIEIEAVFGQLEKNPKQLELFMKFIQKIEYFSPKPQKYYKKDKLLKENNISSAILKGLEEKNILKIDKLEVDRLDLSETEVTKIKELSAAQEQAYNEINQAFLGKNVCLLQGVTSSGKTEIYVKLIEKTLQEGKQVLYLLPEIALTAQIVNRLRVVFGNKTGIYHSKYSDSERVEVWKNLNTENKKRYEIILGVRSSIFLPFSNLGLIIVDEEHENNYKQTAPAPRYNARDAAIVLAQMHGAKVLLGTATPSIESYYNAVNGRFALVKLTERFGNVTMPKIVVADLIRLRKKKQMKGHFSPILIENMQKSLSEGKQSILFQNRRGFSPFLECNTCGWVPKCDFCDVSLTYYKFTNKLVCHYCGFTISMPTNCLACNDSALQTKGFGTEKVESDIAILFPEHKIARMDLDTTRSRTAYQSIIQKFESKNIDILIGTQMISKGLDFDNVSIVGILNADNMLNFPDFRAHERSFQLMLQVSGRAGRRSEQGLVVIQTAEPEHYVIKHVITNDFEAFYKTQITERQRFRYPPFYRIILITLKHKHLETLNKASEALALHLKNIFADRILGPESPPINRIQNFYIKNILVKIEREKAQSKAKEYIRQMIGSLKSELHFRGLQVIVNVDPM